MRIAAVHAENGALAAMISGVTNRWWSGISEDIDRTSIEGIGYELGSHRR
jgi:hypothetical protein